MVLGTIWSLAAFFLCIMLPSFARKKAEKICGQLVENMALPRFSPASGLFVPMLQSQMIQLIAGQLQLLCRPFDGIPEGQPFPTQPLHQSKTIL